MAAPSVSAAAPRRSRRGWWLLAVLALGLPVVTGLVLWLWSGTQGDLDAAAERLRALGLPTTGKEWGRVVADPDRLAKRRRIETLAVALDTYRNDFDYRDFRSESVQTHLVTALPEGLVAFQTRCDSAQAVELEDLVLGLGDQPLAVTEEILPSFRNEFGSDRPWHFLRQRVLAAAVPEAERAARAALVLTRTPDGVGALYANFQCNLMLRAIAIRMASGALFSPALAQDLEATATRLIAQHPRAVAAEAVLFLTLFRKGFIATAKPLGLALPGIMETPVLNDLIFRAGRAQIIDDLGARAAFQRDHHQVREWVDEGTRRWVAVWSGSRRYSSNSLLMSTFSGLLNPGSIVSCASTAMHAQLLAAELRQGPWPEDLLDRGRHQLRSLGSSGQTFGAYSVGGDGIDNGGGRGDIRYLLRSAPLGVPPPP